MEHSHKTEREEVAVRAKDYVQRYHALLTSVNTYVHHMQDSIPVWKEFNDQYHGLSEWLNHVNGELGSEHTLPGNAFVTERSLENSEVCGHWSYLGTDFWLTTLLHFTHTHTHTHAHAHAHPHTHMHTRTHAHTHTTPVSTPSLSHIPLPTPSHSHPPTSSGSAS